MFRHDGQKGKFKRVEAVTAGEAADAIFLGAPRPEFILRLLIALKLPEDVGAPVLHGPDVNL
jgi:hypothetical protein